MLFRVFSVIFVWFFALLGFVGFTRFLPLGLSFVFVSVFPRTCSVCGFTLLLLFVFAHVSRPVYLQFSLPATPPRLLCLAHYPTLCTIHFEL